MLTEAAVQRITGDAGKWLDPLSMAMDAYEIDTKSRAAMFLAQCAHESAGFALLVENLDYTAAALLRVFGRYFTPEQAEQFARQPERIAERVYANRLGNGPEGIGDGWRFRGRGLIQITGRDNYVACGLALCFDLTTQPGLLELPDWAAASAAWFWRRAGCNAMADADDYAGITRAINGGLTGFDDRQARLATIEGVLA